MLFSTVECLDIRRINAAASVHETVRRVDGHLRKVFHFHILRYSAAP